MSKIKHIQFGLGIDALGSKMSLSTERGTTKLEHWWEQDPDGKWHHIGFKAISGKHGRTVGIPISNIKGMELHHDGHDKGTPVVGEPKPAISLPPKRQSGVHKVEIK